MHQSLLEQAPPTAKLNLDNYFYICFCTTCGKLHGHPPQNTHPSPTSSATPTKDVVNEFSFFFVDSQSKNSKENFQIVNQNFARVRKNEAIITQTLKHYENTIGSLSSAELNSEKISIVTTLVQEAQSRKSTFLQKIGVLSAKVEIPKEIEMLEILARNPSYCSSFFLL